MPRLPAIELVNILEPAYTPCRAFASACAGTATWSPARGHVPRGFLGGAGSIDDIELILLTAEPGNPHCHACRGPDLVPRSILATTIADTHRCFQDKADLFHRNMRRILDLAFPGLALDDQLRRVWITNSYLCSAPKEAGRVPVAAANTCGATYLKAQLQLLSNCPLIAFGGKAHDRANRLLGSIPNLSTRLFRGYAASPPGCNHRDAYKSWCAAVNSAREYLKSLPVTDALD